MFSPTSLYEDTTTRRGMRKIDTMFFCFFGYSVCTTSQTLFWGLVSASQDEAVRHDKMGVFHGFRVFAFSRRHLPAFWVWRGICFPACLFYTACFHSPKCLLSSSRLWAHEVIRKRNIEGVLFTSGDSGVLVWSHFGKCLGGGRIETKSVSSVFLRHPQGSWNGLYLGNYVELVEFLAWSRYCK